MTIYGGKEAAWRGDGYVMLTFTGNVHRIGRWEGQEKRRKGRGWLLDITLNCGRGVVNSESDVPF